MPLRVKLGLTRTWHQVRGPLAHSGVKPVHARVGEHPWYATENGAAPLIPRRVCSYTLSKDCTSIASTVRSEELSLLPNILRTCVRSYTPWLTDKALRSLLMSILSLRSCVRVCPRYLNYLTPLELYLRPISNVLTFFCIIYSSPYFIAYVSHTFNICVAYIVEIDAHISTMWSA